MLSINDRPDIRALFAGCHLRELQVRYILGGNQARHARKPTPTTELLISNQTLA